LSNNSLTNDVLFHFTVMAGFPNLTLLNLSGNKLAGVIPVPKNSRLMVLNLSHNEITGFSDSTFPSSLKALVITHNKLTEIPAGLPSSLNNLMLSYNEITSCELNRLPATLERFSLSHNKIETLPIDFTTLTELRNANFNGNGLKKLPVQFPSSLEILDFGNNSLLNICASLFSGLSLTSLANINFKGNLLHF
jgi:Leucine-rich repeat (LRR) protein